MIRGVLVLIRSLKYALSYLIRPLRTRIKVLFDYCYLAYYGVETKLGYVRLEGLPIIHRHPQARIIVGPQTVLTSHSKYNSAGINHPVILGAIRPGALLHIHGKFGASGSALVAMSAIEIEEGVGIGANSHVYDNDFHPVGWATNTEIKTKPVKIGKNVWVAANCLILKNVVVGDNAVIAAGSVVTSAVEANTVYGGVPARKIKNIEAY